MRVKKVALTLLAALAVLVTLVVGASLLTRWGMQSYTQRAQRLEGPYAIDVLEKVTIGGIPQWVHIRGQDRRNPVILYLHGGPGAAMMPYEHVFQPAWERDFTVVQWDQRGAGKTAIENRRHPGPVVTFDLMTSDALEMSRHLRRRLNQEKIFLLGHSWGTILGLPLAQAHPELFHAFIGTGVVINIEENERAGYAHVIEMARNKGDSAALEELADILPYPDFTPENHGRKEMVLRTWQMRYGVARVGHTDIPRYERLMLWRALFSPQYSVRDLTYFSKPSWARHTYDGLRLWMLRYDARQSGMQWRTPLVFIVGRQDWQTPSVLAKAYFDEVQAPAKRFVWIEGAAHATPTEQVDAFARALRDQVKPLASLPYDTGSLVCEYASDGPGRCVTAAAQPQVEMGR